MPQLSFSQQQSLRENGFVQLPNLIPAPLVNRAVQTIYHHLGQGIPSEQLATWQSQSFFPELQKTPTITDLVNETPLLPLLQALIGSQNALPVGSGQLALRFPQPYGTPPRPPYPHIDGVHSKHNGVPQGQLHSFTALVGVFLTDVTTENAGNFAVWPGSHRQMERHFQGHGIDALMNEGVMPPVESAPLQIQAKAGDCVIAHYQLLHGVTINIAPNPRFAVFFRIKHPQHEEHKLECLTDLWREWPGMAE